jgi:tetraacyldisaccharide 4'-kinase
MMAGGVMANPRFWENPPNAPGLLAHLLAPAAWVYQRLQAKRLTRVNPRKLGVPVICITEAGFGGAGKTPAVIALASHLKAQGFQPHVIASPMLSGLTGPIKVDERRHTPDQVGDEALLIAAFCDCWQGPDRHETAIAAISAGADILLLDGETGGPAIAHDLTLLAVDAVAGFGNGRVFPAGGLRLPPATALDRSDAVILIGGKQARARFLETWPIANTKPIFAAKLAPLETGMTWAGGKFLAFTNMRRPEKFFATLRGLGADVIQTEILDPAEPLTSRLLGRLEADAFFKGAQMVTTERDATRLPDAFKLRVVTLPVRLQFQDFQQVDALLKSAGINPPRNVSKP